jgi:hypothetical protein
MGPILSHCNVSTVANHWDLMFQPQTHNSKGWIYQVQAYGQHIYIKSRPERTLSKAYCQSTITLLNGHTTLIDTREYALELEWSINQQTSLRQAKYGKELKPVCQCTALAAPGRFQPHKRIRWPDRLLSLRFREADHLQKQHKALPTHGSSVKSDTGLVGWWIESHSCWTAFDMWFSEIPCRCSTIRRSPEGKSIDQFPGLENKI